MTPTHTRVVCFGNRLHGDDAFGCHVHDRLQEGGVNVEVYDGGTAGLAAMALFEGCRRVVVVDALRAPPGCPVGLVRCLSPDDVIEEDAGMSTHAQGLGYIFRTLPIALDSVPDIDVVVATVGPISTFVEALSPPVAGAVAPAVSLVEELLSPSRGEEHV